MQFRKVLNKNIPLEVQRGIISVICAEYGHTHAEINKRYAKEEAVVVEPHVRRANIESALLELADRFKDDVQIAVGGTTKGHRYRYLVCGQLVITESYVENNRRVPREASFRNDFAGDPNQMLLDPAAESERIQALKAQSYTYVIITHSPSILNPAEPSDVTAVLVDKKCRYVDSVSLVHNVAVLTAESAQTELVEDRRHAKLRKGVGAKRKVGS